jgi:hypothetical protein
MLERSHSNAIDVENVSHVMLLTRSMSLNMMVINHLNVSNVRRHLIIRRIYDVICAFTAEVSHIPALYVVKDLYVRIIW